jgi:hypothetical protein
MLTPEDIDLYNKDTIPLNPEQYQAKKAEIVGKLNTLEKQFAKQNFSDAKLLPVIFLTPLDVYPGVCGNWSPLIEYGLSLEHYPKIEKWLKNSTLTQQLIADGFKSSDITIRRQSAFVLSELGTNLAAKVLSQNGLRSRDRTIRFFSCQGLAKAYGVRSICGGGFEWTSHEKVEYFKKMSEFVDGSPALSKACKLPDPRPKSKNPTRVFWIGYPLPSLPDSTKEAELIVCGSLKSIPKSKSKSHDRLARIVVERILKNSKNQDLKSIVVSTYSGWSHNKGIFFLKRQPDGKYDCLNGPYLETLPYVSSSGIPNNPNPKDLELILLKQMVDIASCPESSLNVGRQIASDPSYDRAMAAFIKREIAKYGKDSEFTKVIYSSNDCSDADDARARAYSTLIALPKSKTIPLLRAKLDSNELDETAKIWIVNALISLGDYKAISAIQDLLLSDKPLSSSSDWAMLSLCQTLSGNNDSGNRIEVEDLNEETKQLSALMSSKRVRVRRACAQNLRHLYPAQEPLEKAQLALMHIALSDPDEEVRFQAISALEQMWSDEIDRQCTEEEFNCHQEKYIERIKRLAFMHNLEPAKAKQMTRRASLLRPPLATSSS